jgi:Fe-S-cluster-containing dehydrogenase component/DMSO reductase anchor subunit
VPGSASSGQNDVGRRALEREERRRLPILSVERKLQAQRTLTAVERFAKRHEEDESPAQAKYYRSLLPTRLPDQGEQLAFQVDLDRCTGCKACVTACHSLNGLDDGESWRMVGLLHTEDAETPRNQTVTSSCHHCADPGCLRGCPVGAYEKDPKTGIVKHLDDQCFGCKYCTLMCPYDAPKYNSSLGIVRKCDMCSQRMSAGEAPACVQACPNEAIRIEVVPTKDAVALSERGEFLPGAPSPRATAPTTQYTSNKGIPENWRAADRNVLRVEHAHVPLVVMLVLTQLGLGSLVWSALLSPLPSGSSVTPFASGVTAFGWLFLGLVASVLHLGRPWLAYRAIMNLRHSWLSREALTLGVFAKFAALYPIALLPVDWFSFPGQLLLQAHASQLRWLAIGLGSLGVFCSAMVYAATQREYWKLTHTLSRFLGTALVLGAANQAAVSLLGTTRASGIDLAGAVSLFALGLFGSMKLWLETRRFRRSDVPKNPVSAWVTEILRQKLPRLVRARFVLGWSGALIIPAILLTLDVPHTFIQLMAPAMLLAVLTGELLERAAFFMAAPPSRMPGGAP